MKNFVLIIFLSPLIIYLFGCGNADTNQFSMLKQTCELTDKDQFSLVAQAKPISIIVPANSFPEFTHTQVYDNRFLYGYKEGANRIEIFDIILQKHLKSISIDQNFISNLGNFFVHKPDSIFFAKTQSSVVLINDNGKIINQWNLESAPLGWVLPNEAKSTSAPLTFFFTSGKSIVSYSPTNHRIYLNFASPDLWYFKDRLTAKLCATYNISTRKWVATFGQMLGVYKQTIGYRYPFVLSLPQMCVLGDTSIVSFPLNHNVQIYNNKTGKLLSEACIGSRFLKQLPSPLNEEGDAQQERNFLVTSSYYGDISFHKSVGLFSRVVVLPQDLKNSDGTLKRFYQKESSVILFDKNYKIVGEFKFDKAKGFLRAGSTHYVDNVIRLDDGFLGTRQSDLNKNDDTLAVSTHYKIVPIK